MADTLAEIVNTTVTAANLDDGEHTILTTDGNTTQVIKDITLKKGSKVPSDFQANLNVNNFDVITFSSQATGSEIIAPNSTVKLTSSTYPLDIQSISVNSFAATYINEDTGYLVEGSAASTITDGNVSLSGFTFSPTSYYAPVQKHGNIYFQRNLPDSTGFYLKIYNRDTQTTTTVNSETYRPTAYDWENNRFVCITGSTPNISYVSAVDGTQTQVAQAGGVTNNSYAKFSVAGGYGFLANSSAGVQAWKLDGTGFSTVVISGFNTMATNDKFVVSYDSETETFYGVHYDVDRLRVRKWQLSDLTSGNSFASVEVTGDLDTQNGTNKHFMWPNYYAIPTAIGKYQYYIRKDSPYNQLMRLDATDVTKESELVLTVNDNVAYAYPYPKVLTTSEASTAGVDFSDYSIGIRATGVTVS